MSNKSTIYCLVSDNDGHEFVIPAKKRESFFKLLEEAESTGDYNTFIKEFEKSEVYGPITFTDPKVGR